MNFLTMTLETCIQMFSSKVFQVNSLALSKHHVNLLLHKYIYVVFPDKAELSLYSPCKRTRNLVLRVTY